MRMIRSCLEEISLVFDRLIETFVCFARCTGSSQGCRMDSKNVTFEWGQLTCISNRSICEMYHTAQCTRQRPGWAGRCLASLQGTTDAAVLGHEVVGWTELQEKEGQGQRAYFEGLWGYFSFLFIIIIIIIIIFFFFFFFFFFVLALWWCCWCWWCWWGQGKVTVIINDNRLLKNRNHDCCYDSGFIASSARHWCVCSSSGWRPPTLTSGSGGRRGRHITRSHMITFAHVKGPTWQYSILDGYCLYLTYRRIVLSLFEAIWIEMDLCFLSHSILGIFQEHVKVSLVSLQQWWKCCLHVFLRYMLHSPCPGMLGAWKDWCVSNPMSFQCLMCSMLLK